MAASMSFDQDGFYEIVKEAPEHMRDLMRKYPPNRLYRLGKTNRRVTIRGYFRDGTVDVILEIMFNIGLSPLLDGYLLRTSPGELIECSLPKEFRNPHNEHWVNLQ